MGGDDLAEGGDAESVGSPEASKAARALLGLAQVQYLELEYIT